MTEIDPAAIDDYLASLDDDQQHVLDHYYSRVPAIVPDAVVGVSYAMPCYLHRGKGLVSVMATRGGYSFIPFSGSLLPALADEFGVELDLSEKSGTVRVKPDELLPDDLFDRMVELRRDQIDVQARR